jgi:hypothetical protein
MAFGSKYFIMSGGPILYYHNHTLAAAYEEHIFGGNCHVVTVTNDSTANSLQVSYDGTTLVGDINAGETFTFHLSTKTSVHVKGTAGQTCRIWAW